MRRECGSHPLAVSIEAKPTRQLEVLIIQPHNSRRFITGTSIELCLLQIRIVLSSNAFKY